MSYLTEPLKHTLTIGDKSYPINTDFRIWLKICELAADEDKGFQKMVECIILCYKGGNLPPSFFEAANAMWDFFSGAEKQGSKTKDGRCDKRLFDFSQDAEAIYASFLYDYGIDLNCTDMHWHQFLALFRNLSPDSPFMRVVALRSIDVDEIKDPIRSRKIIESQRKFAIYDDFDEIRMAEELSKII